MLVKICLAQLHIHPGNLEDNYKKICQYIQKAEAEEANMLFFAKDSLTGPHLGELGYQTDFQRDVNDYLHKIQDLAGDKLQVIFTDEDELCGYRIMPRNISVNAVGKQILSQIGGTKIISPTHKETVGVPYFEEGLWNLDFNSVSREMHNCQSDVMPLPDDERIFETLKLAAQDFLLHTGITKMTIGLSGGIDSAVAASLYCHILGPENVLLVNMPGKYSSNLTQEAAESLAKNLGCRYLVMPVTDSVKQLQEALKTQGFNPTGLIEENLQARERGSRILAAVAACFGSAFSANGNKAELMVGYSTFYGDMTGALEILGDLWKYQVYELGHYLNKYVYRKEVIPEVIFQIRPSAELSSAQTVGKGGDPLYYPYHDYLFNAFIQGTTPAELAKWYQEKVLEWHLGCHPHMMDILFHNNAQKFFQDLEHWYNAYKGLAVAKRIQAPPIVVVSNYPLGTTEPQLKPYYSSEYLNIKKSLLN